MLKINKLRANKSLRQNKYIPAPGVKKNGKEIPLPHPLEHKRGWRILYLDYFPLSSFVGKCVGRKVVTKGWRGAQPGRVGPRWPLGLSEPSRVIAASLWRIFEPEAGFFSVLRTKANSPRGWAAGTRDTWGHLLRARRLVSGSGQRDEGSGRFRRAGWRRQRSAAWAAALGEAPRGGPAGVGIRRNVLSRKGAKPGVGGPLAPPEPGCRGWKLSEHYRDEFEHPKLPNS